MYEASVVGATESRVHEAQGSGFITIISLGRNVAVELCTPENSAIVSLDGVLMVRLRVAAVVPGCGLRSPSLEVRYM